ncbi:MAG: amino acid permease [Neisseriales bacterium]|nr:MAG: amino acid permease [Neisseriales bacterium]
MTSNNTSSKHQLQLERGLTNRHIQLIIFGCTIGSGLFLGTVPALKLTGPSIILNYLIAGFVVYLVMRQLGEMVVEEPAAGSFSHFAYKYWGEQASFIAGWNSWILYILVSMAELSAVGQLMQFWLPTLPNWITTLVCFLAINALNLMHVKAYAETEFWMSLIKVLAVIGMIAFGAFLLLSGAGGEQASVANLWRNEGGFFAGGLSGFTMALSPVLFSLGGLELVGIAAAEANEPKKAIPKAVNQTIAWLLAFYILSIAILLMLFPWRQVISGGSPFVLIFSKLGSDVTANALNVVIFSAALSAYHACAYAGSRMLFSLAEKKNAPQFFAQVSKRGVPFVAILVSALATFACVVVNFLFAEHAFSIFMMLVVVAALITWSMISLSHLKFREAMQRQCFAPSFKAIGSPVSNYLCLLFVALVIFALIKNGEIASVVAIPLWLVFLSGLFVYKKKRGLS